MVYFIEDAKDGCLITVAKTYAFALLIQHRLWVDKGIDTYII